MPGCFEIRHFICFFLSEKECEFSGVSLGTVFSVAAKLRPLQPVNYGGGVWNQVNHEKKTGNKQ